MEYGNPTIPPVKQLYICLHYFATPECYRTIAEKFGVGKATACRSVLRCSAAIYALRNYFICWPNIDEARQTFQRIEAKTGFPKVLGALDGTHIRIQKPVEDGASYMNRKKVASIQLQVVCNDRLQFLDCYAGFPGSVHDMRVFKYSGIQDRCNDNWFFDNSHILADSAYTLQNHIILPFRDHGFLTIEERHFNYTLSSTRMMVECSIGLLKMRWRRLLDACSVRHRDLLSFYIITCCNLHNLCLKREEEYEYPLALPELQFEDLGPLGPNNVQKQEGLQKRQ